MRLKAVEEAWPDLPEKLKTEDLSIVRELFGEKFLTSEYHLHEVIVMED